MAAGVGAFVDQERSRAAAWKRRTATLPDEARQPAAYVAQDGSLRGRYEFCLPPEFASLSLLPEVRQAALALFDELGIPWHAGVRGGPSNHLLSSQVQCVNALAQMVADPARLQAAFGDVVGTTEVLEIEPGRTLTFEYIGDVDYFGEGAAGPRVRGAKCTSVDAAFLQRAGDGAIELILIEWKYTEAYRPRPPEPGKDATRAGRYRHLLEAPDSPVDPGLLPFDALLDEPLYQLMRQQLLAHELEKDRARGADRVRVVHVAPTANLEYQQSLHRDMQRALGASVAEVWDRLLRRPDRFVSIDSDRFLDPAITSAEYVLRYGATPGGDA